MECLCVFYHFTWDGPICPQFFRGIEDWFRQEYPGQKNCYASTEEVRLLIADSLAELGPVFSWDAWFMVYSQAVVCVKVIYFFGELQQSQPTTKKSWLKYHNSPMMISKVHLLSGVFFFKPAPHPTTEIFQCLKAWEIQPNPIEMPWVFMGCPSDLQGNLLVINGVIIPYKMAESKWVTGVLTPTCFKIVFFFSWSLHAARIHVRLYKLPRMCEEWHDTLSCFRKTKKHPIQITHRCHNFQKNYQGSRTLPVNWPFHLQALQANFRAGKLMLKSKP